MVLEKYLASIVLASILLVTPLATPLAYAEQVSNTITAYIEGGFTDLGTQIYDIRGRQGTYLGYPKFVEPAISFRLQATVTDGTVTGEIIIRIIEQGDSDDDDDDSKVEKLHMTIPVTGGDSVYGCLDLITNEPIVCPSRPWPDNVMPLLELENGDFIPIVFLGAGEATMVYDDDDDWRSFPVFIVVDTSTAQHPFTGNGNTGQVAVKGCDPSDIRCMSDLEAPGLFALIVDVNTFSVKYRGVKMVGEVSGDLIGLMTQTVNADEDHVRDIESHWGNVTLSVRYGDKELSSAGSFFGNSVQMPELDYLYYSTGTFTTSGELALQGSYEIVWVLPMFFGSTITAVVLN